MIYTHTNHSRFEEPEGPAASTFGVRSRNLSNVGRHLKPLVPAAFSVVSTHFKYSFKKTTFYQNDLAMTNTADLTGGKPIAVRSESVYKNMVINVKSFESSL
jgi:hypothetical protein